ncbi:hypothetical protein [Polyangium jinanense]|uniref:hypothetical protein n=1 Tax=Polyangium jinanense TaxID=2829994 RepID=UPI002340E3F5|nr:hypothetical protein [Polyangium jinanense]
MPLVNIQARDVIAFVERLTVTSLSPMACRGRGRISRETATKVLSLVKLALRDAVAQAMSPQNPAVDVRIRKQAKPRSPGPTSYPRSSTPSSPA